MQLRGMRGLGVVCGNNGNEGLRRRDVPDTPVTLRGTIAPNHDAYGAKSQFCYGCKLQRSQRQIGFDLLVFFGFSIRRGCTQRCQGFVCPCQKYRVLINLIQRLLKLECRAVGRYIRIARQWLIREGIRSGVVNKVDQERGGVIALQGCKIFYRLSEYDLLKPVDRRKHENDGLLFSYSIQLMIFPVLSLIGI